MIMYSGFYSQAAVAGGSSADAAFGLYRHTQALIVIRMKCTNEQVESWSQCSHSHCTPMQINGKSATERIEV